MKIFLILIALFSTLLFGESKQYKALLDTAIFQLNNNDYSKSLGIFNTIIEKDSASVFSQLGQLQAYRFQLVEKHGYSYDKSILFSKSDELIHFYESKLIHDPNNADLHFCLAMAVGFKLRSVLGEKNSFYLIMNGLKAFKHIRICEQLDPDNPDIQFAKGLLEYYISNYPGIVKYFSNMIFANTGDREIGRTRMHQAAKKNGFMKVDANYALSFMYLFIENNPAQAVPFIEFLTKNYPRNTSFHFIGTFTHLQLLDYDSAQKHYQQYLNTLKLNKGFYKKEFHQRTIFLDAFFALKNGDTDVAQIKFHKFIEEYDLELEHLLAISYLELGKQMDLENKHNQAIKYYNKVIKIDNRTYPIALAKQYKQNPYQN